jgi:hypothetical protein
VEGVQEFMAQERLLACERVPFVRRNRVERSGDFEGDPVFRGAGAAFVRAGYLVRSRCGDAGRRASRRVSVGAGRGGGI